MEETMRLRLPEIDEHLVIANRVPPADRDVNFWPFQLFNGVGIDPFFTLDEMWRCGTMCDWIVGAAKRARSYRNFDVGCMAIGYDLAGSRLGFRFGANTKLSPGDPQADLQHAEQVAIRKLQVAGYPDITGIAVFGPVQDDTHSGLVTATLHPCGICRGFMLESPEINADEFTIYTMASISDEEFVGERFTLAELVARHTNNIARR